MEQNPNLEELGACHEDAPRPDRNAVETMAVVGTAQGRQRQRPRL